MALTSSLARADLRRFARTLLGCAISYTIARLATLPELYWAIITTLIVITQPSLNQALSTGRDQIIGAGIGAVFGVAGIVAIQHGFKPLYVFAVELVPLAFLTARRPSLRLACVTLVIVVLIPTSGGGSLFERPIDRVLEILIGAVTAFAVTFLLPNRAIRVAHRHATEMLESIAELVTLYLEKPDATDQAEQVNRRCSTAEDGLQAAMEEVGREHIVVSPRHNKVDVIDKVAPLLRRLHRDALFLGRIVAGGPSVAPDPAARSALGGTAKGSWRVLGPEFTAIANILAQSLTARPEGRSMHARRIDATTEPKPKEIRDACAVFVKHAEAVPADDADPPALPFVIKLLAHDLEELVAVMTPGE